MCLRIPTQALWTHRDRHRRLRAHWGWTTRPSCHRADAAASGWTNRWHSWDWSWPHTPCPEPCSGAGRCKSRPARRDTARDTSAPSPRPPRRPTGATRAKPHSRRRSCRLFQMNASRQNLPRQHRSARRCNRRHYVPEARRW